MEASLFCHDPSWKGQPFLTKHDATISSEDVLKLGVSLFSQVTQRFQAWRGSALS